MDLASLNWLTIGLSAISTFVIGGLWYGPMFGRVWMEEMGFTEDDLKEANMAKIYGVAFILEVIITINLAVFIKGNGAGMGAFYGFLAGFGWVAAAMGINALFSRSTFLLWFINSFYFVITFTLTGFLLGMWP